MDGSLVFSANGKRVAYVAKRGEKWLVVVDEVAGEEYDSIGRDGVAFSPESDQVACLARRRDRWLVVVDGVEGAEYDWFFREAKLGFDTPKSFHTLAGRGNELLRVEIEIVQE